MSSAYKVYASVLTGKLRRELGEKSVMLDSQAGFREGNGVIDNICTLNYVVGRELGRGGNVIVALVDLKAAFKSVDRRVLGVSLRKGVKK